MVDTTAAASTPEVRDTYWGYTIADTEDRFDRETLVEIVMRFLGLILVVAAYAQWLLPPSIFPGDPFLTKASLAFILAAGGVGIYYYGSRGLATEVHVDLSRREVRLSRRNSRGQTRLRRVIPMRQIQSAYIRRSRDRAVPSELQLRFRNSSAVLTVANGTVEELEKLHQRLSTDLRIPRERVENRLAKTIPFQTQRA